MTLEEYLAIPYVLVVDSIRKPSGEWVRRAEYPEIGCTCEAATPIEAMDRVDEERVRYITERLKKGEPIPVPRPPLRSRSGKLNAERLAFGKWLVDKGRVTEA